MNEINPEARQLTYAEFPTKFAWNKCIREWDDSKNDWVRKKSMDRKAARILHRKDRIRTSNSWRKTLLENVVELC